MIQGQFEGRRVCRRNELTITNRHASPTKTVSVQSTRTSIPFRSRLSTYAHSLYSQVLTAEVPNENNRPAQADPWLISTERDLDVNRGSQQKIRTRMRRYKTIIQGVMVVNNWTLEYILMEQGLRKESLSRRMLTAGTRARERQQLQEYAVSVLARSRQRQGHYN